jgi:tRNA (mo5U34)-methyltransferase
MHPGDPAATVSAGHDAIDLGARVAEMDWYHTQELAPGMVTPGMFDLRPYVDRYRIPADLSGQRVLDIGTFEGFWAFELERRGAEVVALDIDRIQNLDWPPRLRPAEDGTRGEGFEIACGLLGSSAQRVGLSVYEATAERLGGSFDLVFCGSVLIHLRDPMLALERMAALCSGRLILADEYSRRLSWIPGTAAAEFVGESPWMTWWRPSVRGWRSMVRCAGFEEVEVVDRFRLRFRATRGAVPHVVLHARGPTVA